MMSNGIKRKALSVVEKRSIITKVDEDPHLTRVQIATDLNLPVATVNGILTKRDTLLANASHSLKIKKIKKGKYENIEEKLLVWFKQARNANIPINGTILCEKAEEISKKFFVEFNPSNGWIGRFRKREGLSYKTVCGESKSVNVEEVDDWKSNVLPELLSAYEAKEVFNADECALFYNLIPDKTYSFTGDSSHRVKVSKERLTVLVGANMDGTEKLPLLVIGKSKNPRCFKNVKTLPCNNRNSKNAWMTVKIFEDFLMEFQKQMAKENRKVLLFLDNCTAHPKDVDHLENIKVVFLPPNSTSLLQPMDQGIIKTMKHFYRKRLVYWLLQKLESDSSYTRCTLKLNLLDAMHFIVSSWEKVSSSAITNCFRKAGFNTAQLSFSAEENSDDNNEVWESLQKKLNFKSSFEEFVNVDQDVPTFEMQTTDDICDIEMQEDEGTETQEDDCRPIPTSAEAGKALETFRRFIESHECVPADIMRNLREMDTYFVNLDEKRKKQTLLDQYFCNPLA